MSAKSQTVCGRITVPLESDEGRNKNGKNKVTSHAAFLRNMSQEQSPSSFHPFMLWKSVTLCHSSFAVQTQRLAEDSPKPRRLGSAQRSRATDFPFSDLYTVSFIYNKINRLKKSHAPPPQDPGEKTRPYKASV